MNIYRYVSLLLLFLSCQAFALEPRSEHTFALAEGETPPEVTLDAFNWLVGNWTGNIFGEKFEEVWNAPSSGSMVGMFKIHNDERVNFYELQLITDDGEGIALLVKHFSPPFTSWEDKEEYVRFPFIGLEADAIHFDGISFYRLGDNNLEAYIMLDFDGDVREEKITYQRIDV